MFKQRLTENAKNILGLLKQATPKGSYIAGGTGLALWLDHRNSYDLDIYSPTEFSVEELSRNFEFKIPDFQLISTSWQTIHGKSKDTEVSLFFYPYKLLKKTEPFLDFEVASIEDITAMKLEAIAGRGLKRDFFDLYKIMQFKGWDLKAILDLHEGKYLRKGSFTPHLLRSLTYFEDAEHTAERATEVEKEWEEIKGFFVKTVNREAIDIICD